MANLLGIDIGQNSVRGVLVKTQLRRVQLAGYFEVPISEVVPAAHDGVPVPTMTDALVAAGNPEGAPPPGVSAAEHAQAVHAEALAEHARQSPLGRAIAELLRLAGGTNIDIIAPLSGDTVSLRRVELPKAAEKKLDELLPFEMESVLPFELADTLLDYQAIELDPKQLRLLVSAAPKARIREELTRLAEAGADPVELVPAPAALAGLAQFVPTLATDGPHMVIVLGPSSTDVCVIRKGRCELARTLSVGANDLIQKTFARVPSLYETPSGPMLDEAQAQHLGRELKQTLLAYRMQGGGEPESLSLGGEGTFPALFEWLGTHLSRSVVPLALPEIVGAQLAGGVGAGGDATTRLVFATSLGVVGHSLLRGKHLDFRKGEFVKKRDLSFFRDFGPILGVAASAVACAFFFSIWARWSVLDDRRQLLEDELARVTETRLGEETRDPTRAHSLLETGRRSADPMPAFTAYDALVAVNHAIPEDITHDLSRLAIDLGDARSGGHIEIQGTVGTVDDAERISRALGEVECFRSLELGPATTTAEGRRNYRIEGDILCPGAVTEEGGRRGRRRRSSSSDESSSEGGEG